MQNEQGHELFSSFECPAKIKVDPISNPYTAFPIRKSCSPTFLQELFMLQQNHHFEFLFLFTNYGANPYLQNPFHPERFGHFTVPRVTPRAVLFASRACVLAKGRNPTGCC